MALSPMMQQYVDIKNKYPDCIIFFRLGDFYEMFFEQAELCSRELELTLTGKDCGENERAPMCGIPYHSVSGYIAKLVEKGYKIGICEQIEDPKLAKGLVKRDIVKIITPGTVTETNILDETKNNYVANIFCIGRQYSLSYADISTGECFTTYAEDIEAPYRIIDEVLKVKPKELILDDNMLSDKYIVENVVKKSGMYISRYHNTDESILDNANWIPTDISISEKKSLSLLINYIVDTQKTHISQINKIVKYNIQDYMRLDQSTIRNLEVVEGNRDKTKKGSLLWVLDKTSTAMGARKLRNWVENPLLDVKTIQERLNATEVLVNNIFSREEIISLLRNVRDIERLATKVTNNTVNARDLVAMKNSFKILPNIKKVLQGLESTSLQKSFLWKINEAIDSLQDLYNMIELSIQDDPPISVTDGMVIKSGYNALVDEYRMASKEGKNWIMQLEAKEKQETNIKNLKIGYNKVFGYYIEITKSSFKDIPEGRYIRKQTLTDKERFITPELKEIEDKILGSEEKLISLEYKLFCEIREKIASQVVRIQRTAEAVAQLDVLCSYAKVAEEYNYVKPIVNELDEINICGGRHPVVERMLKVEQFIPNDTVINNSLSSFHIITGPNMAGKSTYMRQVAIIVYMAQIGCFVSADRATIGIVDRIFTRVGASDDLAGGESTFMVEMKELSNILQNATSRSLVILDEIGRGTSTYDGMAIAWSTVEYISDAQKIGSKTLFATHYHELVELETKIPGVKNFSVAVKEKGDDVTFLRKIVEGPADESYGIYVAKLAGVPTQVVSRAKTILKELESNDVKKSASTSKTKVIDNNMQVDMFNYKLAEVGRMLDKMTLDELTAKDALDALYKLKEKMN